MPSARTTPAAMPPTSTPVLVLVALDGFAEDDAAAMGTDADDEWRILCVTVSISVTAVGVRVVVI